MSRISVQTVIQFFSFIQYQDGFAENEMSLMGKCRNPISDLSLFRDCGVEYT